MNATAESSIAFLAAFEAAPMVRYVLTVEVPSELRTMYKMHVRNRVEAACNHVEGIPNDLREERYFDQLSTISFYCEAAIIDLAREAEHLQTALQMLEAILAERGDR